MVKEFFKSTFRTLGRIFAYIVLGILAYMIFQWFGISTAHAATLTPNNLQFEGYHIFPDNTYFYDAGNTSSYTWDSPRNYSINRSNAVYQNVNILAGHTYLLKWDIEYTVYNENQIDYNFDFVMFFGATTATCDTIVEKYVVETSSDDLLNKYTAHNRLWCYVNSTINANYIYTAYFHVYQSLWSYNITFEFNEQDASSQDIIDNNNANFNKLIDQINQNNAQINQNFYNIDNSINDLDNTMTSEESPDTDIFLDQIEGMQPSPTPVNDIILLPINILNKELQVLGNTCDAWTINWGPLLSDKSLSIPCIYPGRYLNGYSWQGYTLWELIDFMVCLFLGYQIMMLVIAAYNDITSLNDTFHSMYTPTSYWQDPGKRYYS